MSETSEHVQRLAEWQEEAFAQLGVEIPDEGSALVLAQDALDASGATARIEAMRESLKKITEASSLTTCRDIARAALDERERAESIREAL